MTKNTKYNIKVLLIILMIILSSFCYSFILMSVGLDKLKIIMPISLFLSTTGFVLIKLQDM